MTLALARVAGQGADQKLAQESVGPVAPPHWLNLVAAITLVGWYNRNHTLVSTR